MKYLLLILTVVIFSSCVTQKRCAQKFPPQVKVVTETVTETIYRDTTIYVHIKADTVYSEKIIYETPDGWQTEKSTLDMLYSYSTAQVINGTLKHELFQKESYIDQVIKNAIKENSTNTIETIVETHEVRYIPKLYWIGLGLVLGLGLIGWVKRS